eukprot:2167608-Amphidinium_carterae.1
MTSTAATPPKEEVVARQTEPEANELPPTDFVLSVDRSKGEKLGLVAYNNSGESFLRIRGTLSFHQQLGCGCEYST